MTLPDKFLTTLDTRWYQTAALEALFSYFMSNDGNPIIALPTGSGKSVVQAKFLEIVLKTYPDQRIMCLTHVKELVQNNAQQMRRMWAHAPVGIYSSGLKQRDLHYPITFGNMQSVRNIIEAFGHIDLLLIDECHLVSDGDDSGYLRIIAQLKHRNPFLKVIGFTATKWRTALGLLTNGPIFTDVCYDICTIEGYRRLFDENYLVPPVARRTAVEYDVSEVRSVADDFSKSELNKVTSNEKITWAAIQESLTRGHDRNCRLVFCTGVEHAILAADMFKHLGLRAAAVHSKMSDAERDGIMGAFFSGELDTLTNNGICTTGIDHPPIDHIVMLRPTKSVGLWVQMLGRGTRPFETNGWRKENCLVTDHGGNSRRLGTIDDPYIPKQKVKGAGDMPVKICPVCDAYNHARAVVCVSCGEPFEIRVGFKKEASEEPLVRSDLPIYETFKVQQVLYTQYFKKNATPTDKPTIKAIYICGLRQFVEFVAIEATGFLAKRARDWWRQRFPDAGFMPATVADAMQHFDKLIPPKTIKVHVNRKYPEIVEYGW